VNTVQKPHRPNFAIFGGSFNPPHQGHVELIRAVLSEAQVDHVFAVPANRSPFKSGPPSLPGDLRCDMMRTALRDNARTTVLDWEITRPAPSYSVHTVEALRAACPQADLHFVMGSDVFRTFRDWHRADRILDLAGLIVLDRADGGEPMGSDPQAWAALLPERWKASACKVSSAELADAQGRTLVRLLRTAIPAISSSHIREAQALEAVPPGARDMLRHYLASQLQ